MKNNPIMINLLYCWRWALSLYVVHNHRIFYLNKHYRNSMQIDQTQKTEKSLNTDQDFLKSKKSFKGSTCYCELSSDDDPT